MPPSQRERGIQGSRPAGTFAFGLSGGLPGVQQRPDMFGVVVLAVVVGLAGGITAAADRGAGDRP